MPLATLGGSGWNMTADSLYQINCVTSAGVAAPPGARFIAAKVIAIGGGSSPQLQIRNGKTDGAPLVRTVAATVNATIDQRAAPDYCVDGIFVTVTGNPKSFELEVLWR